jgi:plasmid maintenance system antidote protein VapI
MSGKEFGDFLKQHGLSAVDVAAATKIHPATVSRFVKGARIHRSTLAALESYASKHQVSPPPPKAASG